MKRLFLAVILLTASVVWAQSTSDTILVSGGTIRVANPNGASSASFEEKASGSPATVSVTVAGCMRGQTCDTVADTNTSTTNVIRGVTFTKAYDYFLVTASWTGGTNPFYTINSRIGSGGGGGGAGGAVQVTAPVDVSGYVNIDCKVGCSGSNPNGQATMANSAPVVIASDQSAVSTTDNVTKWSGSTLGAVANYGTSPGAVLVPGVNSFVTNTVTVTGTVTTTPPSNASTNLAQVAGSTLGAIANYGTSPGAVLVPGVNAFVTNTVTVSGTVTTTPPSNASTNVAQFGGVAVSTGVGASGTGIPRVTVANDSNILSTQSGNWTVRNVGNAGGIFDAAGQNAASPANELLIAAQFNTTPSTVTSGNVSPLQIDSAGNLLVNIKAGSSGNAAASATGSAVPASADYQGVNVAGNLRGQTGVNPTGSVFAGQVDLTSLNAVSLGSPSSYGTSPGAVSVIGVNAFVTNVNANGQNTMANSAPVVIASNQSTLNTQDSADGTVVPGAAASKSQLGGSQFNYVPPSVANGQQVATQSDAFGRQLVVAPIAEALLAQLVQIKATSGGGPVRGLFGRPITSTGDALDVNIKYPPASGDPCSGPKINLAVSQSASTQLVFGSQGRYHVCSMLLVSTTAQTISLVGGTGSTCGTGTTAVIGSTTAANGMPPPANGGWSYGDGLGTIAQDNVSGNNLCLLQSGAGLIAGNLTLAVAPY